MRRLPILSVHRKSFARTRL